ncbi:chorismate--pyruvate lyase [Faecalicatena sp. AGMB00832]|uniref:Chorismate--pyruvate lyase n=1 Tax=Faecalicatena faecalis TaxID=2726362 RepID=A0ABS6D2U0_9FIRM|nr:chorismate--pyruvate lyase [Faecalicatena faecalis]MBU3875813.1 chorismate--pyruvate lyase [Faecalicatena faecalis]
MLTCTYIVEKIDGDYAMLRRTDETDPNAEAKMVARALLPPEINEGTRLLYEYLQYSIIE